MYIRQLIPMGSVLAIVLSSQVAEPLTDARLTAIAKSMQVAQLPAPTGHRQPTLNDLPPSLREEEKSDAEAGPTQDSQADIPNVEQDGRQTGRRRTPREQFDNGVPRICDPC
jgi:hypothetical protein